MPNLDLVSSSTGPTFGICSMEPRRGALVISGDHDFRDPLVVAFRRAGFEPAIEVPDLEKVASMRDGGALAAAVIDVDHLPTEYPLEQVVGALAHFPTTGSGCGYGTMIAVVLVVNDALRLPFSVSRDAFIIGRPGPLEITRRGRWDNPEQLVTRCLDLLPRPWRLFIEGDATPGLI